jgi:hypothetical protein
MTLIKPFVAGLLAIGIIGSVIPCEVAEAQMLLANARRLYPEAVSAIEKAIAI